MQCALVEGPERIFLLKDFVVGLCATALTCAATAQACDLCAIYSSIEAKGSKPGLSLGVFEQFTHFGTLQEGGTEVSNTVDQYLDSSITQLIAGWQFNERFGLQVNVPMIYRSFKRPEGLTIQHGTASGLGDMSLLGRFQLYQRNKVHSTIAVNLLAGVKFPTGDPNRLKEELDETPPPPGATESGIHGHDLALGSGSYDGIVGGAVFARWNRLFGAANTQYAIRSEGFIDYRYANDLLWSGGPGVFLILEDHATLTLQLNVSGEYKGKDTLEGEKAEDTGLTAVYLGPEFSLTWREKLSTIIGVDLPVIQDNTALQILPDYRIRAAATWRF